MYKKDFALNDLRWLICHETKTKIKSTTPDKKKL